MPIQCLTQTPATYATIQHNIQLVLSASSSDIGLSKLTTDEKLGETFSPYGHLLEGTSVSNPQHAYLLPCSFTLYTAT